MARIVDLSLPLQPGMRGVDFEPARRIEADGWNAQNLHLYSHCGTHMDAPRHFDDGAPGLDSLPLAECIGPARVVDLTPACERELITVERLAQWHGKAGFGTRLLLQTDWGKRAGEPSYRGALPRMGLELAEWLVERGVVLIGVETPSFADVNNIEELAAVRRTLLAGGVVVVEGLANLDRLTQPIVTFIALPLSIEGGDGAPCRAIAIEE